MDGLTAAVASRLPEMLARIRTLAEQESPTEDPAAVNAAGELVIRWAAPLGASVTHHHPGPVARLTAGDTLELRFGVHASACVPSPGPWDELADTPAHAAAGSARSAMSPMPPGMSTVAAQRPILLIGHLDTVWPRGTLPRMPVREESGRLHGPGVLDMKAGIVMALTALAVRRNRQRPVTLLLAADEETGSATSRRVTERLALQSACALVLEPAQDLACKTARKGVGHFELHVSGIAAHAGVDFTRGHSAITELAWQIGQISALTDLARGLTVNCGVVRGGTRSNVVAAEASVEIDVRIAQAADATELVSRLHALTPRDPACSLRLTGGINRPPMERTPDIADLFTHARACAQQLGFPLDEAATGGGSDGNFTAALGVPTLDGLGAVGEGAHAPHEHIVLAHLAPRTALLAALLDTL